MEGKYLSSLMFQGMQTHLITQDTVTLSSDIAAFIDHTDKNVRIYDQLLVFRVTKKNNAAFFINDYKILNVLQNYLFYFVQVYKTLSLLYRQTIQ